MGGDQRGRPPSAGDRDLAAQDFVPAASATSNVMALCLTPALIRLYSPYASSEEARLDLPKELRNDHPGSSRAEEEEDEKQRKQQEFARQLQKSMKKEN